MPNAGLVRCAVPGALLPGCQAQRRDVTGSELGVGPFHFLEGVEVPWTCGLAAPRGGAALFLPPSGSFLFPISKHGFICLLALYPLLLKGLYKILLVS